MSTPTGYTCHSCGQWHDELPLAYGPPAPVYWSDELAGRDNSVLESDYCIMKAELFFVVGNLQIPVIDTGETFSWDVWASLSRESMTRALDVWTTTGRESEPPYFGWLSSELIEIYGVSTLDLKAHVHTRPVGLRPTVELEPTDHPLAVEQRTGMTRARVQEIAEILTHG